MACARIAVTISGGRDDTVVGNEPADTRRLVRRRSEATSRRWWARVGGTTTSAVLSGSTSPLTTSEVVIWAQVIPEPGNPKDPNALRVTVDWDRVVSPTPVTLLTSERPTDVVRGGEGGTDLGG